MYLVAEVHFLLDSNFEIIPESYLPDDVGQ